MGRKSTLTPKQWAEIEQRLLCVRPNSPPETIRGLAREYEISESAIRLKFSAHHKQAKTVADQIVTAERNFRALPVAAQVTTLTLAAQLRAISDNLGNAAMNSAATAHRLSSMANAQLIKIDESKPLDEEGRKTLSDISALTKMANDAAVIPMDLLAANAKTMEKMNAPEETEAQAVLVVPGLAANADAWSAQMQK
jgi:hypothetical protein